MKINRRNFEDAPHGSAIFEDMKMIKRPNMNLYKVSKTLNFDHVPHGSAIFEKSEARPVCQRTPLARAL